MKTAKEAYNQHLRRMQKAIALEKTDRTPVLITTDSFYSNNIDVKLPEFCANAELSSQTILDSLKHLGDVDAIDFCTSHALSLKLKQLLGVKLQENTLYQIYKKRLMTEEDYDTILNKGFEYFFTDYVESRLNLDMNKTFKQPEYFSIAQQKFEKEGFVTCCTVLSSFEVDYLITGRTLENFVKDLHKMPDKVFAVLDVIHEYHIKSLRQQIRSTKPFSVFVSTIRDASQFYSKKHWDRIIGKYYKSIADMVIEEGSIVQWHINGGYDKDLNFFRDFPKGKCIFAPDSTMNIYKVKEVLGDIMAIQCNTPLALLTLGTPDEVYDYCAKLVKDMGSGFIMGSGYCVPYNAKMENVQAMVAAATGR
ncbi:uroporphyrinogen-III decarboxylase [Clostridium sp. PL3]|uniref:Uroporphyrinogen-III decarboxylase n=1 Tax=Clostridium thailandense TaxID=2794346 RepID=A0A949TUQ1_9CLOT|nr:uroporphyrinogen decarboxylase family protein [Clostridium thailandense]MBV7276827.1 uroporphyrinogen-III decarboxylase [Clostridium thailandense]